MNPVALEYSITTLLGNLYQSHKYEASRGNAAMSAYAEMTVKTGDSALKEKKWQSFYKMSL